MEILTSFVSPAEMLKSVIDSQLADTISHTAISRMAIIILFFIALFILSQAECVHLTTHFLPLTM